MVVASLIAQAVIFSRYPSIYYSNESFSFVSLLVMPTLFAYGVIIKRYNTENQLIKRLWIVWGFYVFTFLIPMVGLIFVGLREKLDSNQFFGPNILKITMCGSALIALQLVSTSLTTNSTKGYHDLMGKLLADIALDLFDDIEILEMVLHLPDNEMMTISPWMDKMIIACVFLSLALSVLEMGENKIGIIGEHEPRRSLYLCRLVSQILLVNLPLLAIRLVLWLSYKYDASIFIAKNSMSILISLLEILKVSNYCGCKHEDDNTQFQKYLGGFDNNRRRLFLGLDPRNAKALPRRPDFYF